MNKDQPASHKLQTRISNLSDASARIQAWGAALEGGSQLGDEESRNLLAERARLLAREPDRTHEGESIDVVEFLLGDERYAFESSFVGEVHPLRDLTPLPCTPAFVLGIVNVRGQLLPVVDLVEFLGLRRRERAVHPRIIVLHADGVRLGVLADALLGVSSIPIDEIQASLPTLTGLQAELLRGVAGRELAILDAAAIMSDEKMVINEEVEA